MSVSLIYCILALLLACILAWMLDGWLLRRAARRIDASYKAGARKPQWTPLTNSDGFSAEVLARLDAWDVLCRHQFGLVPLVRLRECCADGEVLGVRSVLVNEDRTIMATYACSHRNPLVAFRSFASLIGDKVLMASDARILYDRPARYLLEAFPKEASEQALFNRLTELRTSTAGAPRTIDSIETYIEFQREMWQDADKLRRQRHSIVDFESLRKLAPPNLGASRLRRLHRHITELNRS